MNSGILRCVLLALVLFGVSACGPELVTDVEPPSETATARSLLPSQIDGLLPVVSPIEAPAHIVEAVSAVYGDGEYHVRIIKGRDVSASFYYSRREGKRFFFTMSRTRSYVRDKRYPYWETSASDDTDGNWVAWTNDRWVFFLGASDEERLARLVDLFPYIRAEAEE